MELHSLRDADCELNHFFQTKRWLLLETVLDSGAAESLVALSMAPWIYMEERDGSRSSHTYLSVTGDGLPNWKERSGQSPRQMDTRRQPPTKWQR